MAIKLGINTGFALNRFTTPEEWLPLVGETLGLKIVQFTADLLNPVLPDDIINDQISRIKQLGQKHGVAVKHTFTSAFTRVNHFAHPDPKLRKYWLYWFYRFIDISCALGAESVGSHLAILTVKDNNDPALRKERLANIFDAWAKLSEYGAKKGLKFLTWEPMSIPRELGETIETTRQIQQTLEQRAAMPIKLCLDVDHGDVSSTNPADTDPYAWLNEFATDTLLVHIKQNTKDKGGHWPFTAEHNKNGKIIPEKIISILKAKTKNDVTLLLELSFRERQPFENMVVEDLKSSVDYWRPFAEVTP